MAISYWTISIFLILVKKIKFFWRKWKVELAKKNIWESLKKKGIFGRMWEKNMRKEIVKTWKKILNFLILQGVDVVTKEEFGEKDSNIFFKIKLKRVFSFIKQW